MSEECAGYKGSPGQPKRMQDENRKSRMSGVSAG